MCNFRFVQERLQPDLINLDLLSIIVYNIPQINYKCHNQVSNISGYIRTGWVTVTCTLHPTPTQTNYIFLTHNT